MIIHPIHDINNKHVINILSSGLKKITEEKLINNYHPDFSADTANLFYILENGRYRSGLGTYFVLEEDGKYICSAGWNKYQPIPDTAIILSRMYVAPEFRSNYIIGKHILPICIGESIIDHVNLWMTYHAINTKTKKWFDHWRDKHGVPVEYKKFNYLGIKNIYNTEQYVYGYAGVK